MSITDIKTATYLISVTVGGKRTTITFREEKGSYTAGQQPQFAIQISEGERKQLEAALAPNPLREL